MKRLLALILALIFCLSLVACTASGKSDKDGKDDQSSLNDKDDEKKPPEIVDRTYFIRSYLDNFKLHGRTSIIADGLACDTSASGFEFNAYIEGELKMQLSVSQNCYFTLYIDGKRVEERIFRRPVDNNTEFVLATFDDKKVHNIKLLKQTESLLALSVFQNVSFKGYFDTTPADKQIFIEFLGDSITSGFGNLCDGKTANSHTAPYQDATQTYAFLTAEKLNADASLLSYSGIAVSATKWMPFVMEDYFKADSYVRDKNAPFVAKRAPDVVVINLGTNDQSQGIVLTTLMDRVKALVDLVRDTYGKKVPIVWVHGMMEKVSYDSFKIVFEALYKDPDKSRVYLFSVAQNNQGGGAHPSLEAHYSVSEDLSKFLEEKFFSKK